MNEPRGELQSLSRMEFDILKKKLGEERAVRIIIRAKAIRDFLSKKNDGEIKKVNYELK